MRNAIPQYELPGTEEAFNLAGETQAQQPITQAPPRWRVILTFDSGEDANDLVKQLLRAKKNGHVPPLYASLLSMAINKAAAVALEKAEPGSLP